jgi:hypothetical protein
MVTGGINPSSDHLMGFVDHVQVETEADAAKHDVHVLPR